MVGAAMSQKAVGLWEGPHYTPSVVGPVTRAEGAGRAEGQRHNLPKVMLHRAALMWERQAGDPQPVLLSCCGDRGTAGTQCGEWAQEGCPEDLMGRSCSSPLCRMRQQVQCPEQDLVQGMDTTHPQLADESACLLHRQLALLPHDALNGLEDVPSHGDIPTDVDVASLLLQRFVHRLGQLLL